MKTVYRALFFYFWALLPAWSIENNKLISLQFKETPISVILHTLAEQQNLNLIFDDSHQQLITVKLNNVTWRQAIEHILKLGHLNMEHHDNILLITSNKELAELHQSDALLLREKERNQPLTMITISPNYFSVETLTEMIQQQQLLSDRGKAFADNKNNIVIIHDIAQRISTIQSLIKSFDKPDKQVEISAHIVSIGRDSLREMGVNWGYQGGKSQTLNQLGFTMPVVNPAAQLGLQVAKFSGHFLSLELSALEAENNVNVIANPRLLTSNNKKASIKQGSEIPYEIYYGKEDDKVRLEFKEAVLGLEVTPRILNNGLIELTLHITQNAVGQKIKQRHGGEIVTIDKQEIQTQVIVKNNETLVLGGIFHQQKIENGRSVPGLSKIPILGNLFKYQQHEQKKRELIIFITPKIEID